MTSKQAMFVFVVGLLVTFGAVGGIENSLTDGELLTAVVVALLGLLVMYCGTLAMRVADSYDR